MYNKLNDFQKNNFPAFMKEVFPGFESLDSSNVDEFDIPILLLNEKNPSLFLGALALRDFCANQNISCVEYLLLNEEPPEILTNIEDNINKFAPINFTSSYKEIFSSLWHAKLPCFETGETKLPSGPDRSILKRCIWKDVEIPCSKIFTTFPTDQGMCCTFNMKAADEIFVDSYYSNLIKELQDNDRNMAIETAELSEFFKKNNEPQTRAGKNMGLKVILDAHSDTIESLSVTQNFEGFTGTITDPGSFILRNLGGFDIKPGHINHVALSAVVIDADDNLKDLPPETRNCLFADETKNIRLHKEYSQDNCFLECSLVFAQNQMMEKFNMTVACTPWNFPIINEVHSVCNPWETQNISTIMQSQVPSGRCDYCLPDCRRNIYSMTISTQPFRRCDERSLEVSPMCSVLRKSIPKPEMWGRQVEDYFTQNLTDLRSAILSNITSSKRTVKQSFVLHGMFPGLTSEYDAYEKDIAVLNVYFDSTTVLKIKSEKRQTWIDFFSNVGGALGLCIGLSIVTIVELFWVCLTLVKPHCKNSDKVEIFK
jgi:hypothetical protein